MTTVNKPHKHAKYIKLWADGARIEYRNLSNKWAYTSAPNWCDEVEYRVQPEIVPDAVGYACALYKFGALYISNAHDEKDCEDNLKITFDGTTKKLKSVEIV